MSKLWIALVAVVLAVPAHASDQRSLSFGGLERTYLVHRPAGLGRDAPVPLVIVLHGGFGWGAQAERSYGWDAEADKGGFVVVYPDGVRRAWNAGGICCGKPNRDDVDDVGFLTRLIRTVAHDENIDPKRVYLTGISNGAAMSYRYGCEGSFPVAAIGAVAGSFSYSCAKAHPVSVMEIHGLDDHNIPFAGGKGPKGVSGVSWLGVEQTLDVFREADDCGPLSIERDGVVETHTAHCAQGRDVTLITVAGAGHQWPGAKPVRGVFAWMFLDPPSTAFDATNKLWRFFRDHPAE